MKTLLIPLDGSDFAEEALGSVFEHPAGTTRVILMACVDLNQLVGYMPEFPPQVFLDREEEAEQGYRDYLREKAEPLQTAGYAVQVVVQTGDPVDGILRTAQSESADLIVLTSHGRSGIKRLLVGSVTEGVVRRATCPVLIVPPKERRNA